MYVAVVIICIDKDEDNRRFTLRASERGFAGEEFVYIVPDYVRDENKTDVWMDQKAVNDNRDVESRRSMENVLFVSALRCSCLLTWNKFSATKLSPKLNISFTGSFSTFALEYIGKYSLFAILCILSFFVSLIIG